MNKLDYLLRYMEDRGVPRNKVLAGSGINASDVRSVSFSPSVTQYRVVLRNIVSMSPPGVGIDMGLATTIADEGVLGYAALSSARLGDVNNLIKKYLQLAVDFVHYSDAIVENEWHIEFSPVYPMGDLEPFLIEDLFAQAAFQFRFYTGVDIPFKSLDFAYPQPSYVSRYREVFPCPLRFGTERNRLILDAKYLDLPIVLSNPDVCKLCEAQCARMLGELQHSPDICTDIRRRLILNPGKYPSIAEMSEAMQMSPASLQRKLREEGETYQDILNNFRKELAIQYLEQTSLSPKEISYKLGFSNVHNFRRAFKAWTGSNPSQYR